MRKYTIKEAVMNYPAQFREQRFCCWKWAKQSGRDTKVPYNPKTGMRAKTDDLTTFSTFDEALEQMDSVTTYAGIGVNIAEPGEGLAHVGCIDLDHCIKDDNTLSDSAEEVLNLLPDALAEVSPSGTGLHLFFIMPDEFNFDSNTYYVNNRKKGKEIYLPGLIKPHFMTVTGKIYRKGAMVVSSDQLQSFLDTYMKRASAIKVNVKLPSGGSVLTNEEVIAKLSAEPDQKFIDMYRGNWEEYAPADSENNWTQSDADMTVLMKLAFYCRGDMAQMDELFRESGLMRDKWDRRIADTTYGVYSMTKAVNLCNSFYEPRATAAEDFADVEEDDNDLIKEVVSDMILGHAADPDHADELGHSVEPDKVNHNGVTDGGDVNTDDDAVTRLNKQLSLLISSNPTSDDLYKDENITLAAYARMTDPASYEKLRAIIQKNKMSIKLYEQKVKEKVEQVQAIREEKLLDGMAVPGFFYYNKTANRYCVDPAKLAIHVKENLPFILVEDSLRDTRTKYVYEDGVYKICSDEKFKGYIKRFIEDFDPELVCMKDVEEAFRNVSTTLEAVPYDQLNSDEDIINFRNGLLRISTLELEPHTPNVLSTIQLNCEWKGEDTPTPKFDAYLDMLTDFSWEIKNLLLQFMGVTLSNIHGPKYKKALFLSGPGNTGKSQLKILTERLLGRDNFAAIDLSELESQFGASMIYGKRLAGTADMTFMTIRELKMFKTITGGDNIRMEFKGKTPFSYNYNGLLWFCMNRPPKFGGDTGSWVYDRIMLVECPNVIQASEQDRELVDKMYAERDGIVYKAVMALKETIANGYCFTEPASVTEARENYRAENDSVTMFFRDCLVERKKPGSISATDHETVTLVHKIYIGWCKINNNGYYKPLDEFKQGYADYVGMPLDKAIGRRGRGMYFLFHEVTEEAACNLLRSDRDARMELAQMGK